MLVCYAHISLIHYQSNYQSTYKLICMYSIFHLNNFHIEIMLYLSLSTAKTYEQAAHYIKFDLYFHTNTYTSKLPFPHLPPLKIRNNKIHNSKRNKMIV